MDRSDVEWRGYWPAAPTPFGADGSLDEGALRAVLGMYTDLGVHGVLVNGTTGEWFSQSAEERHTVARIAVEELRGRCPVVVGCTAYTPAEVITHATHALGVGADGVMATPPPYAHPSQEELLAFYRSVTSAVPGPWMAYNWPRGTGVEISVATMARLADLDAVVAIKESTPDEMKSLVACEAVCDRVRFFGRFIHRRGMAFLREIGGDGNIDGGGLGAQFAVPYYEAVWQGDISAARSLGARYAALSDQLVKPDYGGRFASPTPQLKAAMNILGQAGGKVRPPLLDVADADVLADLGAALAAGGLRA